ncbi:MAG TPA: lysophospholipid acyltransferase family protein [Thermoanaerobaculia bacterium]|nr:lysophospholipid acyltransferase family protein [Thermoanaerobaculia bacterium]
MIGFLASLIIRALRATIRIAHVRVENIEQQPQYILAFWHAHLLLMLHSRYRRPIQVMISRSKDGEYIARVFDWYGVEAARGSSSRGGSQALRELIKAAKKGANIVFTPDGPRGPNRIAQEGVVYAAQATGLPIIPVAFAAKKKSCSAPGTGWSCRCRSRGRSSCMVSRSASRAMRTSRSSACASSVRSTRSRRRPKG